MKRIELKEADTGGGCTAYVGKLPNGWEVVITDGGASIPCPGDKEVLVGIYKDEFWNEPVAEPETVALERPHRIKDHDHLKNICEAIAWQVAVKHCELVEEDPHAQEHLGPDRRALLVEHLEQHWPELRRLFSAANWPDTKAGRAAQVIDNDMNDILEVLRGN